MTLVYSGFGLDGDPHSLFTVLCDRLAETVEASDTVPFPPSPIALLVAPDATLRRREDKSQNEDYVISIDAKGGKRPDCSAATQERNPMVAAVCLPGREFRQPDG